MRQLLVSLAMMTTLAQQPQNPSPMVEHIRSHPRLSEQPPAGRREPLELGTLFLAAGLKLKPGMPLLVHLHGAPRIAEAAAARNRMAAIAIQIGAGSAVYARPFTDPLLFGRLLEEAERKAGAGFGPVTLTSWSAGYGAVREILKQSRYYDRVLRVILIDGLHAGYTGGKPGPLESSLETENLAVFVQYARDAALGRKQMIVTHSEIFPGTYASTTETAEYLLRELGLARRPTLKWGPMAMQQLGEARRGGFRLLSYAGNSAPDHVDQLHALPELLRMFPD